MAASDPLVDFEAVVLDLRRRGLSYRAIAGEIGVSDTTVKNYASRGACPAYDVGERLLQVWMSITLSGRGQIPKRVLCQPSFQTQANDVRRLVGVTASRDMVLWLADVEARYKISDDTRRRWEENGTLPPRDVFVGGRSGWRLKTIEAFEASPSGESKRSSV